jgi:hypothetical protein
MHTFQHQTLSQSVQMTHPILVIEHDCVSRGEVDAEPTRTCAQKEEPRGTWLVAAFLEAIHLRAAFQWTRRTVDAA